MNELAIAFLAAPEVRTYPLAKHPWLRFQIGRTQKRQTQEPVYDGGSLAGYRDGKWEETFLVIGWGSTMEAAEKMANKSL